MDRSCDTNKVEFALHNQKGGICVSNTDSFFSPNNNQRCFARQELDVEEEGSDLILCDFSQGDEEARSEIFSADTQTHTHTFFFGALKYLMPDNCLHFLLFLVILWK